MARSGVGALSQTFKEHHRKLYRLLQFGLPLGILFSCLYLRKTDNKSIEAASFRAFDFFNRERPRAYQDVGIRVLDLDEESMKRLGQWPWPRVKLAEMIDRLHEMGVAVVAFDALFPEPDRTSPANIVPLWPSTPETKALLARAKTLPDHDAILAKSIAKNGNVVTAFYLEPEPNAKKPKVKAVIFESGDDPSRYLVHFQGAVTNLPELEQAAAGNGSMSFVPEHDGLIRRVPILFRLRTGYIPSLAAETLRVATGGKRYKIVSSGGTKEESYGAHLGIRRIQIEKLEFPTDKNGAIWVYYTRPEDDAKRVIPVWKIFEKDFDPGTLANKIVFFGTSAAGLRDIRATPMDPAASGVSVHAQIAEQILLKNYLERPNWAKGAEMIFIFLTGLAVIGLLPWLGAALCAGLGLGAIAAASWFSWHQFITNRVLIDPVLPSVSLLGIYLASSLVAYLLSESERKQVRSAFSLYMHPSMVEELAKDPTKLKLGGETRNMTILFSDIRGFTTMSEQFDSHGLTQRINQILTPLTGVIMDRKGYVDKYIGDCIMAFWNAPLEDKEHSKNACRSALMLSRKLEELRPRFAEEDKAAGRKVAPLDIGIGLNTGDCCVGNLGADMRFNYSVLGDDVNLASRLEGQSKAYGVRIVIGPQTRELAPEFATLELDLLQVKGKTKPVQIFTLVGEPGLNEDENFKALSAAHESLLKTYRAQKWDEARAKIGECLEIIGRDGPSHDALAAVKKFYPILEKRIADFEKAPPGEGWNGVYIATSK